MGLEEKAINWYFSRMFGKTILSASGVKSGIIFEPGCGSGMTCAQFAQDGFDITLMDLSPNALKKALTTFENFGQSCKFTIGDLFNLPFPDEEFDVVFNQGLDRRIWNILDENISHYGTDSSQGGLTQTNLNILSVRSQLLRI